MLRKKIAGVWNSKILIYWIVLGWSCTECIKWKTWVQLWLFWQMYLKLLKFYQDVFLCNSYDCPTNNKGKDIIPILNWFQNKLISIKLSSFFYLINKIDTKPKKQPNIVLDFDCLHLKFLSFINNSRWTSII